MHNTDEKHTQLKSQFRMPRTMIQFMEKENPDTIFYILESESICPSVVFHSLRPCGL